MAGPRPERDPVAKVVGTVVGGASGRGAASEIEELLEGEFGGLATPPLPHSPLSGVTFGELEDPRMLRPWRRLAEICVPPLVVIMGRA